VTASLHSVQWMFGWASRDWAGLVVGEGQRALGADPELDAVDAARGLRPRRAGRGECSVSRWRPPRICRGVGMAAQGVARGRRAACRRAGAQRACGSRRRGWEGGRRWARRRFWSRRAEVRKGCSRGSELGARAVQAQAIHRHGRRCLPRPAARARPGTRLARADSVATPRAASRYTSSWLTGNARSPSVTQRCVCSAAGREGGSGRGRHFAAPSRGRAAGVFSSFFIRAHEGTAGTVPYSCIVSANVGAVCGRRPFVGPSGDPGSAIASPGPLQNPRRAKTVCLWCHWHSGYA
jgi:hypothetical protein